AARARTRRRDRRDGRARRRPPGLGRRCDRRSNAAARECAAARRAGAPARRLADRKRPSAVRSRDPRRPARRAPRLGRPLGVRPRGVDRESTGTRPVSHRRFQRRTRVDGDSRTRARRADRLAGDATSRRSGTAVGARQSRTPCDDRIAARNVASRSAHVASECGARGRVDRYRLAGDDGTWSIWFEGPADLNTTLESYVALKMCGADPGRLAREYIRSEGGVARARLFTKCFLALLGQWPWQKIVPIPPELVLLPASAP